MAESARVPFPQAREDFTQDPRVSWSKADEKWILEDEDGSEWEFVEGVGKWVPTLDEALVEQQRKAYAVPGVDESTPAETLRKKKRKEREEREKEAGSDDPTGKNKKPRNNDKPRAERKNCAVYVTSLPPDVTVEEVVETFSRYGIIAQEVDSGQPRVKLYLDEQGNPKGDALVVYFRPESVPLAIQMLDDTEFRLGEHNPAGHMRVREAEKSYKKVKDAPEQPNKRDQKKIIRRTQELNSKLADWSDDEPSTLPEPNSKWEKVVILKHMFTLQELADDPAALLDIKDDIRDECSKLGAVTNVVLYDKEPAGVVTVRFGTVEAAQACVLMMSGRHFDGRQVVAYISDGTERFKKSGGGGHAFEEDEEEQQARLKRLAEWSKREGDAAEA
ncbi:hypothetical protein EJ06DRAFT_529333 [Trichodelitschia bisporula]|uniref:RRM domain-containing protein n=1 Tax=Trichodelitschia bisporula TaxID=703511 RepID=A0A6G1HZ40_9PEZI|nr:hypothetical protein EJ06DRAFT_529333 [Trichodelitschia bisporula]